MIHPRTQLRTTHTHGITARAFSPAGILPQAALAALLVMGGCASESRVVRFRPMLSDLPGAQVGSAIVGPAASAGSRSTLDSNPDYFIEEEDGTLIAQLPTGAYLVYHLTQAIENDEQEIFTTQLLSSVTIQEFKDRGLEPALAYQEVVRRRKDMIALFRRIPQGEYSPNVHLEMLGRNVGRIRVYGTAARTLAWDGMDMVYERGGWRLRWFTPGSGKSLAE